jgi:hypothetical protein
MAFRLSVSGPTQSIGSVTFHGTWNGAVVGCSGGPPNVRFSWGYTAFSFLTPERSGGNNPTGSWSDSASVDKDRGTKFRATGVDCDTGEQSTAISFKTFADQASFGAPSASGITETTATVSINYTPNTNATAGQGGSTASLSVFYREQGSAGSYIEAPVASGLSGGSGAGHNKGLVDLAPSRHYEFFFRAVRDTANLQVLNSAIGVFTTDGPGVPPPGPPPIVAEDEWLLCYRNQTDMDRMSADSLKVGALYRDMDPVLCRVEVLTNVAFTWQKKTAPGLANEEFYFDFDIGASPFVVARQSLKIAAEEAPLLTDDFSAAASVVIAVTYDESTHKWRVERTGGGVLNLLTRTGANNRASAWGWLGFATDVDHTLSSGYTAENPTFTDVDEQHFIQCFSQGYKDTPAGDYTGVASGVIKLAPDVTRVLLERHMNVPAARVNAASFAAGRTAPFGSMPVVVHLVQQERAAAVLERLEHGALADVVVDGEGVIHWVPYTDSTVRRSFFDRDYASWSMRRRTEHIVSGVRVFYRTLPHDKRQGAVRSVELHDAGIQAKYGRTVVQEFQTYLDHQTANAEAVAAALLQLGTFAPRVAHFTALSKLVDLKVADVIELNRSRALDPTGALDGVRFKISRLRRNRATGISTCEAVEYLDLDL